MNKDIFMELLLAKEFKAVRSILNVMNAVDSLTPCRAGR